MLALAFMLTAAATPLDVAAVATSKQGCPLQLVDNAAHSFAEAQLACDAYTAFALVDELRAIDSAEQRDARVARDAIDSGDAHDARVAALHKLLEDALTRGQRSFRKLPTLTLEGHKISTSVLARGYLVAMMGGMQAAQALPGDRVALYDAIAASLVDDLTRAERDGTWLPSYAGGHWPCDHALAASGLALHASDASQAAGRALARRLRKLLDEPKGFTTQVNAKGKIVEPLPRGTVLAWTAGFLALGGHRDEAKAIADVFARDFCEPLPLIGGASDVRICREWPRGVDRKADEVSGPIVMGYGSGASALAIAAFRITGNEEMARGLEALMPIAPSLKIAPDVREDPKKFPLENAILLWGAQATPWKL